MTQGSGRGPIQRHDLGFVQVCFKSPLFCKSVRPDAIEALLWAELADVALAYASLRLHSQRLFSRIRDRVAQSAFLLPPEETSPWSDGQLLPQVTVDDLWQSLLSGEPLAPPMPLPPDIVARFVEAHLHLGHVAVCQAGLGHN